MSRSAWIMLAVTWAVILFFSFKFFWMVLRAQGDHPDDANEPERAASKTPER